MPWVFPDSFDLLFFVFCFLCFRFFISYEELNSFVNDFELMQIVHSVFQTSCKQQWQHKKRYYNTLAPELDETTYCNLYNRFGVGYHMTLVKGDTFNENRTISLMSEMVPTAKMSSNVGAEMSYVLEEESSKQFKPLFEILEGQYV